VKNQGEWKFWVYIMASKSRVIYVGMTGSLEQRVWEHKTEAVEEFSQKYKCHRLVHFECFDDVRNAIAREKEIKAWRREKKVRLIEAANPTWEDLAGEWFASVQQTFEKSRSLTAKAVRDDTGKGLRVAAGVKG
jgi:putative endonuclease